MPHNAAVALQGLRCVCLKTLKPEMTAVGFEPTQLALVELESTPLDHSGKVSLSVCKPVTSELLLARS